MAIIKLNKIKAAKRQINAAIRFLFNNEDPIAIHTLSMAGFRILRDLAKKQNNDINKLTQNFIKPGMEGKFWGSMQSLANFLKHADRDPDGKIDNIHEEVNDAILMLASLYYQDLGYQLTPEMMALIAWYSALHSDHIHSGVLKEQSKTVKGFLIGKSRQQQLIEGKEALEAAMVFAQKGTDPSR